MQQHMMKTTEIPAAVMKIKISHFRVTQRSIISQRPHPGRLYLSRPVQPGIDDVYLPLRLQEADAPVNDLLQGRKIFESCSEKYNVELQFRQYRVTYTSMYKAQVWVVIKDPGCLLQQAARVF